MNPSRSPDLLLKPGETLDGVLDGSIRIIQSSRGYRFSIDALLLSEFVTVKEGDTVIDLGTGCGVILLLLIKTRAIGRGIGLEIQSELASQARRNALFNQTTDRMDVILADIRNLPLAAGIADVVVCNPPYRSKTSGRINPDPQRAIARHEMLVDLDDIISASAYLLAKKGRAAFIYAAPRLTDLLLCLRRHRLEPKRIQPVHPSPSSAAKLVMVEAASGSRPGLTFLPPVVGQGRFSIAKPS
jgi:tRNA1Val (adenine37-N6)-methyltransferase